jgi:hypothetical protein
MTDPTYPAPPRPTLDDLDPESATTDRLIAMVRSHRAGEDYPTGEVLLGNLPVVLRALCDHLLSGETTAPDMAYRLASIIDAIEGSRGQPAPSSTIQAHALTVATCNRKSANLQSTSLLNFGSPF